MVGKTIQSDAEMAMLEDTASQSWLSWIVKMIILFKFIITFFLLIYTFVVWVKAKEHPQRLPILVQIFLCLLLQWHTDIVCKTYARSSCCVDYTVN